MAYLAVNQCPKHPKYYSVSVDDEDFGRRITPSKCCGQWRTLHRWLLSADDWEELAAMAGRLTRVPPAKKGGQ